MKICPRCGVQKNVTEFYRKHRTSRELHSHCKECMKAEMAAPEYRARSNARRRHRRFIDPAVSLKSRQQKVWRKYGLSWDDLLKMLVSQNGCCAICRKGITPDSDAKADQPHIDHCHTTGRIRGLLCLTCNTGLGMFGDSLDLLDCARAYLHDAGQAERLSELAPEMGDAIVRSASNNKMQKSAEMTDSIH